MSYMGKTRTNQPVEHQGELSLDGNLAVKGSFQVDSTSSLKEDVSIDGELSTTGDVVVGGNLTTTGYIKPGDYELDEDITISNLPTGLECYYAHARVSNGKLNIVVALFNPANTAVEYASNLAIGQLDLNEEILNQLYPYVGSLLSTKVENLSSLINLAVSEQTIMRIDKLSSSIIFRLSQEAVSADALYGRDERFEFNFLLS